MTGNIIPACEAKTEIVIVNSRFISSAAPAFNVKEAKGFISRSKVKYADASHNVPIFLIGHGRAVTAHCSDAGEPSGTAGRPALAVLMGSGLGDIVVVITRYFGGTKLGTGGLVRAYSDAMRSILAELPKAKKVPTHTVMLSVPYPLYQQSKNLISVQKGEILDEGFTADVEITVRFEVERFEIFQSSLSELSRGKIQAEIIETDHETIVPIRNRKDNSTRAIIN
jgi:uncharacterized YigZ family protein